MKYEPIEKQDASAILDALDGKSELPSGIRHRLESMRHYAMRDADVLANYKRNKPNKELCERWNCTRASLSMAARKLGL